MSALTLEEKARGREWCKKLKLEILRHQYKHAQSPRRRSMLEAQAKQLS